MSSKKSSKLTLAAKLAKKGKVIKASTNSSNSTRKEPSVPDIEDVIVAAKTENIRYFSPIQTRQQRKASSFNVLDTAPTKKRNKLLSEVLQETTITKKSPPKIKPVIPIEETIKTKKKAETAKTVEIEEENKKYILPWSPPNWLQALENIRKMRRSAAAPVDSMGCNKCADEDAEEKTQRFHKLVALMLSSQTKDETTFEAMKRLKAKTLTPTSILNTPVGIIESLLCPVSFYRVKAKHLKQMAQILVDKYNSDIPNNIKELVALPGIGPKMAHICMSTAWNQVTGIGVDVHVHRITNRLKWLPQPTKQPEKTRVALESWLPQELWAEVNHLFVGFGQTICTPVKPKCDQCLNCLLCPVATQSAKEIFLKNNSWGISPFI